MSAKKERNNLAGGLILVAIGIVALVAEFAEVYLSADLGLLVMPAIGAVFMLAGILTRSARLMVPGGILSGIGWGAYASAGPFEWSSSTQGGGVFLMVFAAGWLSIALFAALFARERATWALIPAAILAIIGLAIFSGGLLLDLVELTGRFSPAVLIVIGAYILLKGLKAQNLHKLDG